MAPFFVSILIEEVVVERGGEKNTVTTAVWLLPTIE